MEILKISSYSDVKSVAGSITKVILSGKNLEIQAIGPNAVNRAVKAIAISRGHLALNGVEISCIPTFFDAKLNGEYRSAIRFIVRFSDLGVPKNDFIQS